MNYSDNVVVDCTELSTCWVLRGPVWLLFYWTSWRRRLSSHLCNVRAFSWVRSLNSHCYIIRFCFYYQFVTLRWFVTLKIYIGSYTKSSV